MAAVKWQPEGYPRLSPYLAVAGAAEAIDFYTKVFGAEARNRMPGPDGKIVHSELVVGDSLLMLADEFPEYGNLSPKSVGGSPVTINLYVEDCDDTFNRAVELGAEAVRPPKDEFYGERSAMVVDPFGHRWNFAQHVEDVSPEEMERRIQEQTGSN